MDGLPGLGAAIQSVNEPGVDGAKGKTAFLVGLLDRRVVLDEPEELDTAGVCGEGQAAQGRQGIGVLARLELTHERCCPGIGPHDGIAERLAGCAVPHDGCLALVGDDD